MHFSGVNRPDFNFICSRWGVRCSSLEEHLLMARKVVESIPIELFLSPANNPGLCYPVCGMVHIKEPLLLIRKEGRKDIFYLTTHSTHFIYGYMASDIWLRTILIVREETRCRHIGYSFRLAARVLLYAPSHRQDSTYHDLCYTSRGALAGTRSSSMGSPHEGSIQRPIAT